LAFLESTSAKHNGAKIQVVAHSMGGLNTMFVLNKKPELFHSVLFAGVPFGRGIGFLRDLHSGDSTGLNSKILSPHVIFSFPSVYSFFPGKGDPSLLIDKDHKPLDLSLGEAEDWIKNKISVFSYSDATDHHKQHLIKALHQAEIFRSEIVAKPNVKYPPIAVLASKATPTVRLMMRDGPKSVRGYDLDTPEKAEGDGRVTFKGVHPPTGVPVMKVYTTELGHSDLLSDPQALHILEDLIKESAK